MALYKKKHTGDNGTSYYLQHSHVITDIMKDYPWEPATLVTENHISFTANSKKAAARQEKKKKNSLPNWGELQHVTKSIQLTADLFWIVAEPTERRSDLK